MDTDSTETVATVAPAVRKQDWFVLLGMPVAAAAALLWLETTDIDRSIASWFFDTTAGRFPLRYDAFLEVVLHHCFPAGHASAGFALMAFYFVGRARRQPLLAWAGLATGLVAGSLLGFGRMLQGAHFLTHTLWAGLVCWAVILILYLAVIGLPKNMRTARMARA